MNRGRYIVLEGAEGVGKTTQLHELARRLRAAGLPVRVLREPDSQSDLTARAIRQLTQDPQYPMNTRTEVLLYNAARSQSLQTIKNSVENGVICLVDRNYLTTLAIQYYGRGDVPDYQTINGIIHFAVGGIEPDLCIVLDAPVTTLRQRLQHRNNGERFDNLDDAFLERVRAGYLWEAKQRQFPIVFATEDPETVANNIWQLVSASLAVRNQQAPVSEPASVAEIIEQRMLPSKPIEEPITKTPPLLPSPSLNLDNISELSLQTLRSSRAVNLSENTPDYLKNRDYYVPENLSESVKKQYREAMDTLFELHATMSQKLKAVDAGDRDAVKAVLPLAACVSVQIDSAQDSNNAAISHLLGAELAESRAHGKDLLSQLPDDALNPEQRQATIAQRVKTDMAVGQLAAEYLPDNHAVSSAEMAALVDYWPKNELLLVPDMLYADSNLPLEQLQSIVNDWPYDKKSLAFKTYISDVQLPGRALEKAHYSWDILSDYATLREFQSYRFVDDLNHQPFTPRYGYEVPNYIDEAGLTDQFEACFDISLKLYSLLQKEGYPAEAQYAVLRGHKLRWKVTCNARAFFKIYRGDQGSNGTLIQQMYEKLSEVHPLLSETISAVEDVED